MPGPEIKETAHQAMDPAAFVGWGTAAGGIAMGFYKAWGWLKAPRQPKPKPATAVELEAVRKDLEALRTDLKREAEDMTDTRERVMQLPTRDDLKELRDRMEHGFERMQDASEARVAKLHDKLNTHIEQHGRPTA